MRHRWLFSRLVSLPNNVPRFYQDIFPYFFLSDLCETLRDLLNLAYLPGVQSKLVQAQYWHDPFQGQPTKLLISQAPVTPELATRSVFRLSRLSDNSCSKTMKKYTPQIEYRGNFGIINFLIQRL